MSQSDPAEAAAAIVALRDQVLATIPGLEDGEDTHTTNVLMMRDRESN